MAEIGERKLVRYWASRRFKHWLKLYRQDFDGAEAYSHQWDHGGGNLGCMALNEAMAAMEEKLRSFRMDGVNLKEVTPQN